MSDGFVTVAQCVEGLPLGRFVWELLFCAMLVWFTLGAINESAPLPSIYASAGWHIDEERARAYLSAVLACGNFLAVLAGGWIADKYGRTAVIRPALLLTLASGMVLDSARSFGQALVARFLLGVVSGSLICIVPALVAELLPSKHRGFYLTVWCSGWPAGALMALLAGCLSPTATTNTYYPTLLLPTIVVYICLRAEMVPESPRYLYLAGRRDEGYCTLLDMYEREDLSFPWGAESIAVTCAPLPKQDSLSSSSSGVQVKGATTDAPASTSTGVALWLAMAMFLISAATQSMKIWMPVVLHSQTPEQSMRDALALLDTQSQRGSTWLVPSSLSGSADLHGSSWPGRSGGERVVLGLLSLAPAEAVMFGTGNAPGGQVDNRAEVGLVGEKKGDHGLWSVLSPSASDRGHLVPLILSQAYMAQITGIVLCAYASMWCRRRQLVQWSLPAAVLFTSLTLCAAQQGAMLMCGPLLGLQFAAQSCSLNFLQAFAAEHFPTSRRAKVVAGVAFAAQLGDVLMPIVGTLMLEHVPRAGAVLFFSSLYVLAWLVCSRLPLPNFQDLPLHDVDEPRNPKEKAARDRKCEFVSYNAI